MHLAYIDESEGASSFTLGCIMIPAANWLSAFDTVLDFRRFLRDKFKIPVRAELKAQYLLQNKGPLRANPLSESARFAVYRSHMRLQAKLNFTTFGVVIRKAELAARGPGQQAKVVAWEYLIQRLERFTTRGNTHVLVNHDEGDGGLVRKMIRRARRIGTAGSAFGTGSLRRPAARIVDDPISRKSHESYFIQFADLTAYAAYRRVYPPPARPVQIVPTGMWDEIGAARLGAVSSGGPAPGLVVWP